MGSTARGQRHGRGGAAILPLLLLSLATFITPAAAAPHKAVPAHRPNPPRALAPAPIRPAAPIKSLLVLSARFGKGLPDVESGLRWRVFLDQPDSNGDYALVAETTEARPLLALEPGGYIVDVAYGLVSQTRRVALGTATERETFTLDCGALRLIGRVSGHDIPAGEITFTLTRKKDGFGQPGTIDLKSGEIARLPAGAYEVSSVYGHANARIISEVRVKPGELTDAVVHQRAGHVHLRLAGAPKPTDGAVLWSVLTPGGDAVVDLTGPAPDVVLAEGDYAAVVRTGDRSFQKTFAVKSGADETVAVPVE